MAAGEFFLNCGIFVVVLTPLVLGAPHVDLTQELHELRSHHPKNASPAPQYAESLLIPFWPNPSILEAIGGVAGVSVSQEGHIFLFQRGSRQWQMGDFDEHNRFVSRDQGPIKESTILEFPDNIEDGDVVNYFGEDIFYLPHGLTVDFDGNVWVTDVALHQVMKFPKGSRKPSMVLGERFVPGSDEKHFCKPTHVAVAKSGDFFVADGYCNSRIMKFNKHGKLVKQWGSSDNVDGKVDSNELNIPHQLTLLEDQDKLCVADRENQRVVCYSAGLHNGSEAGHFRFSVVDSRFGFIYGVAYNAKFNSLFILSGLTDTIPTSDVFVYDIAKKDIIDKVSYPAPQGLGSAHALAVCPQGNCLLVVGLSKECPGPVPELCLLEPSEENQARNVWLYGVLDRSEQKELSVNLPNEA